MIICLYRHRDIHGNIHKYTLKDTRSGVVKELSTSHLKSLLECGELTVQNLKLTFDGRIILKKSKEGKNSTSVYSGDMQQMFNLTNYKSNVMVRPIPNLKKVINKLLLLKHDRIDIKQLNNLYAIIEGDSYTICCDGDQMIIYGDISIALQAQFNNLDFKNVKISDDSKLSFNTVIAYGLVNIGGIDLSSIGDITRMFQGCQIANLNLDNLYIPETVNLETMFDGCTITNISMKNLNAPKLRRMTYLATESTIGQLIISSKNTSRLKNMDNAFDGDNLEIGTLDLTEFDTSKVNSAERAFSALTCNSLNFGDEQFKSLRNACRMFYMANLKKSTLNLKGIDFPNLVNGSMMLFDSVIKAVQINDFKATNLDHVSNMLGISRCGLLSIANLDLTNNDASLKINRLFAGGNFDVMRLRRCTGDLGLVLGNNTMVRTLVIDRGIDNLNIEEFVKYHYASKNYANKDLFVKEISDETIERIKKASKTRVIKFEHISFKYKITAEENIDGPVAKEEYLRVDALAFNSKSKLSKSYFDYYVLYRDTLPLTGSKQFIDLSSYESAKTTGLRINKTNRKVNLSGVI